jgi:hypothetical protein
MYRTDTDTNGYGTQEEKMAQIHRIEAIGYAYIYRR